MNAIRRDEETDNIHSIFVDQWDWEKILRPNERTRDYLHRTVRYIYDALRQTENYIADDYNFIGHLLPEEITFITSAELEAKYPDLCPKEREQARMLAGLTVGAADARPSLHSEPGE
jgi:aspartate--ammonia ligase